MGKLLVIAVSLGILTVFFLLITLFQLRSPKMLKQAPSEKPNPTVWFLFSLVSFAILAIAYSQFFYTNGMMELQIASAMIGMGGVYGFYIGFLSSLRDLLIFNKVHKIQSEPSISTNLQTKPYQRFIEAKRQAIALHNAAPEMPNAHITHETVEHYDPIQQSVSPSCDNSCKGEILMNEQNPCPLCNRSKHMPKGKMLYGHLVCRKCYNSFTHRRHLAFILDVVALQIFVILFSAFLGIILRLTESFPTDIDSLEGGIDLLLIAAFLCKDCFAGQSLGKAICGVKVIDNSTGQSGYLGKSFGRNLPLLIPFMQIFVAFQLAKGHRIGDGWSNSKVIWKKYANHPIFAPSNRSLSGNVQKSVQNYVADKVDESYPPVNLQTKSYQRFIEAKRQAITLHNTADEISNSHITLQKNSGSHFVPPSPVESTQSLIKSDDMPKLIHIYHNNQQEGPYYPEQIQDMMTKGIVTPITLAWKEGMPDWAPLNTIISSPQTCSAPTPPPPPPTYTTSQPSIVSSPVATIGPRGVGGWLLLFCVGLTILGPLFSIGQTRINWIEAQPTLDQFPTLKNAVIWETTCLIALYIYGFIVGCMIWSGNPNGRNIAKKFLLIRFIGFVGVEFVTVIIMGDLPIEVCVSVIGGISGAVFREAIYFSIWWFYFKKSKRVRNTYRVN